MAIQTHESPSPVNAGDSYTITASGGTPPYTFDDSNLPAGVTLTVTGTDSAEVNVDASVAGGTMINVPVQDSSTPPEEGTSVNRVRNPRA